MSKVNDQLRKLNPTLTSKNLAKQIYASDLPEQFIKAIPAQSIYCALKLNGIHSSVELLEITTLEQCRIMIDFDIWQKCYFNEDNFWEWMSVTTESDELALLQKILKCLDLKLITLLISKYVDYEFFEEATDLPPAAGYFTPDKGRTWLYINIENSDRHFLFGRVLALLFETDPNLFYKLLSLSTSQTSTVLEEEAYQDKAKRLAAEGIPENELAAAVCSAANEAEIISRLSVEVNKKPKDKIIDIQAVEPLIYDSSVLKLLNQLINDIHIREDLQSELTYIMNSAIVYYGIDFYEYSNILHLTEKVKGAINIGLEKAQKKTNLSPNDIYYKIGLVKIFQLGLSVLKNLRLKASETKKKLQDSATPEQIIIFGAVIQTFPEIPQNFKDNFHDQESQSLKSATAAFEELSEVEKISELI